MTPAKKIDLETISDEDLLETRLRDLPISLEGTWIADCVDELHKELAGKGLLFKPECYLADEWLTPDKEPAIGIPFYLAHPRLIKLERQMMLEVEGGTKEGCMKLLRHEAGHAINYAYIFFRRRKWQRIFGQFGKEYKDAYKFRPYSKGYVRHLEKFYAQCHPDEDYAESFAVWLTPHLDWQSQYQGWKALKKLTYIDELMLQIRNTPPVIRAGKKHWHLKQLQIKLCNYYRRKKHTYAEDFPDFHDSNLRRIFSERASGADGNSAPVILRKYRKDIYNSVYKWTGQKKYFIDDLLKKIIDRSRELRMVAKHSDEQTVMEIAVYLTTLIMNHMYTDRFSGET